MRLKPSCSWCKDYSKFIENVQLRILLQCYKRLALYIKRSEISKKWANLQTGNTPGVLIGSANSIYNQNNCPSNFKDLIDEGSKYTIEPPLRNFNKSTNNNNSTVTVHQIASTSTMNSNTISTSNNSNSLENKPIQANLITSIKIVDKSDDHHIKNNQATIVRLTSSNVDNNSINQLITNSGHNHLNNQQSLTNNSSINSINQSKTTTTTNTIITTPTKTKQTKMRKGCRCGLATTNPGKLTCCGQRCVCYVEGKACVDCKCRGCRNPNKSNHNNNNHNSINLISTNKTSPSYITTSSSINLSSNDQSNAVSNLFTTSSGSSLQLNSTNNQTNLLSPSFLLSSTNPSSTTLIHSPNITKISVVSPTSSPSAAILLSGHNNVGHSNVESLTLPFPNIENCIEDQVILSEDATLHHQSIIDN